MLLKTKKNGMEKIWTFGEKKLGKMITAAQTQSKQNLIIIIVRFFFFLSLNSTSNRLTPNYLGTPSSTRFSNSDKSGFTSRSPPRHLYKRMYDYRTIIVVGVPIFRYFKPNSDSRGLFSIKSKWTDAFDIWNFIRHINNGISRFNLPTEVVTYVTGGICRS